MTMADVVKTTVLLADINEFGAMNEVYGEFLQSLIRPAQPFR